MLDTFRVPLETLYRSALDGPLPLDIRHWEHYEQALSYLARQRTDLDALPVPLADAQEETPWPSVS